MEKLDSGTVCTPQYILKFTIYQHTYKETQLNNLIYHKQAQNEEHLLISLRGRVEVLMQ